MDNQVDAVISFQNYRIEKIDYRINENYTSQKDVGFDLDFNINLKISTESHQAAVVLEIIINKDFAKNNQPIFLNVVIIGFYSYDSSLSDEKLNDILKTNAVAILFPYLRGFISNITVNSGMPPVILPTLNIIEFLKEKEKNH
jgi:preprotein translocase subunit SecB